MDTDYELWFLVAIVLFAVAAVVRIMARAWDGALVAAGLAAVAIAFLVT